MATRNYVGAYTPTSNVWDVSEIYSTEVTSPAFKELLVRLYQNLNLLSLVVNVKDSAIYIDSEFVTSGQYFASPALSSATQQNPALRGVFRKVVNFGALPNTGTKSVAHDIAPTASFSFTRIYGCSTNPSTSYIPLPYASPVLANNIELNADATNVNVTTGSNRTAYTITYIVLEYIKI